MKRLIVRPGTAPDATAIQSLLEACSLATADLSRSRPDFTVACEGTTVVGVGGLERFGVTGLLRSVAVLPGYRSRGVGQAIVANVERRAIAAGLNELVLLTQTAQEFFELLGYQVIARGNVPACVQESEEFRFLCPQSAFCMSKSLCDAVSDEYTAL